MDDIKIIQEYLDILIEAHKINPFTELGKNSIKILCSYIEIDEKYLLDKLEKEFYNEKNGWYVEPYFMVNNLLKDETKSIKDNTIETSDRFEYEYGYGYVIVDTHESQDMKDKKSNFENAFYSYNSSNLLLIQGTSGCGKSTYLFKIINDFKNKVNQSTTWEEQGNINYIPKKVSNKLDGIQGKLIHAHFNIESITSDIDIEGQTYSSKEIIFARFELMLLKRIYDLLIYFTKDVKILEKIFNNFDFLSSESLLATGTASYFKIIREEIKEINLESNDKIRNKIMLSILSKYSSFKDTFIAKEEVDDETRKRYVKILLNITTIFIFLEAFDKNNKNYFLLITFDGIEHLITESACIHSEDIKNIWDSVYSFFEGFYRSFDADKIHVYTKCVFSARNTTIKMFEKPIDGITRVNDIHITEWYDSASVFDKIKEKIDDIIPRNSKYNKARIQVEKLRETVLHDTDSQKPGNNLISMLKMMYDRDIRKLSYNFYKILGIFITGADIILFKKFPLFMKKERKSNEIDLPNHPMKYICRRSILRLFFNSIKRDQKNNKNILEYIFFADSIDLIDSKDLSTSDYPNIILTMTRRVLIYLLYKFNEDETEYVNLTDLMTCIFKNKPIDIDKFAELLFQLGNIQMHKIENTWNVLVNYKYVDKNKRNKTIGYDDFKDEIKKVANHIWEKGNNEYQSHLKVRLTCSGKFLAFIQGDYELFAARAKPKYPPIIFTRDFNKIKGTIESVYNKAIKCINILIQYEYDYFDEYLKMYSNNTKYLYTENNGEKRPHPLRILTNHITYLVHYKYFIELNSQNYCDNKDYIFSNYESSRILNVVDNYIKKYRKILYALYTGDSEGTDLSKDLRLKSKGKEDKEALYLSAYIKSLNEYQLKKFNEIFLEQCRNL
jgi:hypothetical protein